MTWMQAAEVKPAMDGNAASMLTQVGIMNKVRTLQHRARRDAGATLGHALSSRPCAVISMSTAEMYREVQLLSIAYCVSAAVNRKHRPGHSPVHAVSAPAHAFRAALGEDEAAFTCGEVFFSLPYASSAPIGNFVAQALQRASCLYTLDPAQLGIRVCDIRDAACDKV